MDLVPDERADDAELHPRGLVDERAGGAVHAGRPDQLRGHDPADRHRRLERALRHLPLERTEEALARVGDAAEHDHDLGVEDVDHVGDAGAQELGGFAHDLVGQLVAVVRRLVDRLRGDLLQRAVHVVGEPARLARLDRLDRAPRDGRARRVGLEAAVVAALAAPAVDLDRGVADLARAVRRPVVEPAVDDDPAADAGPDGDPDHLPRAARRAHPPLAQHGAVGVVVDRGRNAERVLHRAGGAEDCSSPGWA